MGILFFKIPTSPNKYDRKYMVKQKNKPKHKASIYCIDYNKEVLVLYLRFIFGSFFQFQKMSFPPLDGIIKEYSEIF